MFESTHGPRGGCRAYVLHPLGGVLLVGMALGACDSEGPQIKGPPKGRIDRTTIAAGVTVTISGDVGTVLVPFLVPVPEVEGDTGGDAELEAELSTAVSLVVSSNNTGATVDLASGTIVEPTPAAPGQWSWELDEDRDLATMTFFTTATNGLTLKPDVVYDATLSIATNAYIKKEKPFAFVVWVVED